MYLSLSLSPRNHATGSDAFRTPEILNESDYFHSSTPPRLPIDPLDPNMWMILTGCATLFGGCGTCSAHPTYSGAHRYTFGIVLFSWRISRGYSGGKVHQEPLFVFTVPRSTRGACLHSSGREGFSGPLLKVGFCLHLRESISSELLKHTYMKAVARRVTSIGDSTDEEGAARWASVGAPGECTPARGRGEGDTERHAENQGHRMSIR